MRGYADVMNAVIARHLDTWQDGAVLDVCQEMTRITMAVAGKTLFDADRFDDADELGAAVRVVFAHVGEQGGNLALVVRAMIGSRLHALGALPTWAPEAEAARPRLSWLPFGAGPRVCIGAQFAILEAQLLLAQIAQRFDLTALSTAPVRPAFENALRPAEPVRVRVRLAGGQRAAA